MATGWIIDGDGVVVAKVSVLPTAERTDWVLSNGLDGYIAAWSAPLKPHRTYILELDTLTPDGEVSVWVSQFNLPKDQQ